jgi:hypothetical protein
MRLIRIAAMDICETQDAKGGSLAGAALIDRQPFQILC